jgi:hypothetical protein
MKEKVLQAMREFGAPVNAGKIAGNLLKFSLTA